MKKALLCKLINTKKRLFLCVTAAALPAFLLFIACSDNSDNGWSPGGHEGGATYTLLLLAGSGAASVSPSGASTHNANTTPTITTTPINAECTFNGWTPEAGIINPNSATTTVFMDQDRLMITANFDCLTYTVTYDINGGTGTTPAAQTVYAENSVTLASGNGFSRDGFIFGGWNTNSDGAGFNRDARSSFTPTNDITLFARWNSGGSFIDPRDGQSYNWVRIGMQVWMAENLNFQIGSSWCYDNDDSNCQKYGRLYDWSTAMDFPSTCNLTSCAFQVQSPHRGICPVGWHVPSEAEWITLINFVGGSTVAGAQLRTTTGWEPHENGDFISGTDNHGFSALPGGSGGVGGHFMRIGTSAEWWSATVDATYGDGARHMDMRSANSRANTTLRGKVHMSSLRCLRSD
ncbi:MAG: InlB B-repeat-containing protein [Chitinispirillales bacterium]|nr:InlB B-repeat-containing protein [Chitinispirillales bacterium]